MSVASVSNLAAHPSDVSGGGSGAHPFGPTPPVHGTPHSSQPPDLMSFVPGGYLPGAPSSVNSSLGLDQAETCRMILQILRDLADRMRGLDARVTRLQDSVDNLSNGDDGAWWQMVSDEWSTRSARPSWQ